MAFRATNVIPQIAYQQVRATARNVKVNSDAFVSQMAASGANYTFLRDVYIFLKNADTQFATLSAVPGIAEYAQQQEDDPTYNVGAEFTAMRNTIAAVLSWMNSNVPTSVTAVAPTAWVQDGPLIATAFTAQQTAPLRTLLQAVSASIV
jgi:hypothetical protein